MAYPAKIRNYNAFLDGVSYFGRTTEATLPVAKINTEDHRGAGMNGPVGVDMGTEKMTSKLMFADWPTEVIKLVGFHKRLVLRPAAMQQRDHSAVGYIATIGGLITKAAAEDLKPGQDNPLGLEMDVDYFKLEVTGGEELLEVDIENAVRRVGGVDQLAEVRAAMGL